MADSFQQETILVTGFPTLRAQCLLEELVRGGHRVFLLVRDRHERRAKEEIRRICREVGGQDNCRVLVGDVTHLDLGLAGETVEEVVQEVQVVHHMATMYHVGVDRSTVHRFNVDGTRRMLELAREMKSLRRFCHYSTAQVAGTREGVILESELEVGQGFHNAYEESRYRAERVVQSMMGELPISIFRPSIVVGSSRTGYVDRLVGPHLIVALFAHLPSRLPLPLPGKGHFPLNLVPVDYVAAAAYRLSQDTRAEGRTFHLTDPNPGSVRSVFNRISDLTHRSRPFDAVANLVPYGLARTAMRVPIIERRTRGALHILDSLHSLAVYNRRNTDELLSHSGPHCPPFDAYAGLLVDHIMNAAPSDFNISFEDEAMLD